MAKHESTSPSAGAVAARKSNPKKPGSTFEARNDEILAIRNRVQFIRHELLGQLRVAQAGVSRIDRMLTKSDHAQHGQSDVRLYFNDIYNALNFIEKIVSLGMSDVAADAETALAQFIESTRSEPEAVLQLANVVSKSARACTSNLRNAGLSFTANIPPYVLIRFHEEALVLVVTAILAAAASRSATGSTILATWSQGPRMGRLRIVAEGARINRDQELGAFDLDPKTFVTTILQSLYAARSVARRYGCELSYDQVSVSPKPKEGKDTDHNFEFMLPVSRLTP